MKKSMFTGMSLLVIGMTFVGCLKNDIEYDENFAYKQKSAMYEQAFINKFGSIAEDHDWGFGQTTGSSAATRAAIAGSDDKEYDCGFYVPDDIVPDKNGKIANLCEAEFNKTTGTTTPEFVFDNYWLLHLNAAQGDHSKMSQLQAFDSNAKNGTGDWIDVTNFKKGKNESIKYFKANTKTKGATLMVNMGGKGDPNHGNKLFRWLEITTQKDGSKDTTFHYDYKFLQCNVAHGNKKLNEMVLGFYGGNHWWLIVVKAANPTNPINYVVEEGRIMCEDLGTKENSDFDFNDILFDAKRYYNGTIYIRILAAGGKLPISVAGKKVDIGEMTNTGVNVNENLQEIIIEPKSDGQPVYSSIKDIPVVVTPGGDAKPYELNTTNGKAPQKICCPINTHWAEEYVGIDKAYTKFANWVKTNDSQKWIEVEVEELTDLDLNTKPNNAE